MRLRRWFWRVHVVGQVPPMLAPFDSRHHVNSRVDALERVNEWNRQTPRVWLYYLAADETLGPDGDQSYSKD